jgi:hypothetical protein
VRHGQGHPHGYRIRASAARCLYVKEAKEVRNNEERGILENSAVREDHDWRLFSVGPRHFSNLSTSLVLRVSFIQKNI